jgi:carotenoid 1,2-hydratase
MTERGAGWLERDADHFRVGPSAMRWEDGGLTVDLDERTFPLPGRIRGSVRVEPEALTGETVTLAERGAHVWRPYAPRARIEVRLRQPNLRWSGSGYLDGNQGDEPIEAGFRRWTWARGDVDGGATVLYDAVRRDGSELALGLRFDEAGRMRTVEPPPPRDLTTTLWRVPRSTRSEAADARVLRTLEDTPFYARSEVAATVDGRERRMVHEALDLDRFAARWVQALLPFRMPRRR